MQALGGALAFMVHLKIDGLVAILERACSYDDLFPGYFKVIHDSVTSENYLSLCLSLSNSLLTKGSISFPRLNISVE